MFSSLMMNTWIAASIVAVIAGVTGFFAVLRGQSFAAHAIPNGAFAGAAGAGLLGLNVIWGLAVFALAGALGIGALGRRARQDVVTALVLVLMLGTGALFLSLSTEYAEVTYSLLFGEVFGVSPNVLVPIAVLGAVSVAAIAVIYRPLLLASALPEVADARGVSTRRMELCFLIVMALATSMTVPVVGALLMFALMIGPAAAARSFTRRPGHAIAAGHRHRPGHRLGRHRAVLPHQLAARVLRRRHRRRVLPPRPGLGRRPPARVRAPPGARAQFGPVIRTGAWFPTGPPRSSERVAGGSVQPPPVRTNDFDFPSSRRARGSG